MTKRERNEAVQRVLERWKEAVGAPPLNLDTDCGTWMKEGFTEGFLLEAITDLLRRPEWKYPSPEAFHQALKDELRRARKARALAKRQGERRSAHAPGRPARLHASRPVAPQAPSTHAPVRVELTGFLLERQERERQINLARMIADNYGEEV